MIKSASISIGQNLTDYIHFCKNCNHQNQFGNIEKIPLNYSCENCGESNQITIAPDGMILCLPCSSYFKENMLKKCDCQEVNISKFGFPISLYEKEGHESYDLCEFKLKMIDHCIHLNQKYHCGNNTHLETMKKRLQKRQVELVCFPPKE